MPLLAVDAGNLCLLLVGGCQEVLVGDESESAADQDDGVEADAQVGLLGAAGAGLGGGGLLGFGGRVVGLFGLVGLVWECVFACDVRALVATCAYSFVAQDVLVLRFRGGVRIRGEDVHRA